MLLLGKSNMKKSLVGWRNPIPQWTARYLARLSFFMGRAVWKDTLLEFAQGGRLSKGPVFALPMAKRTKPEPVSNPATSQLFIRMEDGRLIIVRVRALPDPNWQLRTFLVVRSLNRVSQLFFLLNFLGGSLYNTGHPPSFLRLEPWADLAKENLR